MKIAESAAAIPREVISSPALLYLYHRIEQILGIKVTCDNLIKLNKYIEDQCGDSFIENPAVFEHMLTSREQIYELSKMITINETYFFREGAHFDILERYHLPELAKMGRTIQICSAATSIGCEAYSIAMLLENYREKTKINLDYEIDAFDVSAEAIETATGARYTANTLRADGAGWKHIMDSSLVADGAEFIVSENIRNKVRFFTHNIMRGFNRHYDIIFFRNALIYFSSKNRLVVLNYLAEALFNNGIIFLGISETSSISHPLLASRCLSGTFFFQKTSDYAITDKPQPEGAGRKKPEKTVQSAVSAVSAMPAMPEKSLLTNRGSRRVEHTVNCKDVAAILGVEEGQSNAKNILEILSNGKNLYDEEAFGSVIGNELIAAAFYFLNVQDFSSANLVLSYLEKCNSGAPALFLRGEYYLLQENPDEAERFFESAAGKDKSFWPAFYRIASLAADGNPTRHEYKVKKACESLEMGRESHYECFMGGFSPDYFQRVLTQRIPEIKLS